jgi:hypothetical protein
MKPTIWEFVGGMLDEEGQEITADVAINADRIDSIVWENDDTITIKCLGGERWGISGWTFRELVDRWKAGRTLSVKEGA